VCDLISEFRYSCPFINILFFELVYFLPKLIFEGLKEKCFACFLWYFTFKIIYSLSKNFTKIGSNAENAIFTFKEGTNVRKAISEVCAFFVLQCTVFVRKGKHKTDVTAWHEINFHKNNLWNILVIRNYYVNFQNYQNHMLLSSSDTRRTLMHLFLFTNSA